MIKSMTGFGKAELELPNKKVTIEIKSLNSKQIDLNVRMPSLYRAKELELRALLSNKIERGKVDFGMFIESTGEELKHTFNKELAVNYYEEIKRIAEAIDQEGNYLSLVLKMPDVMKAEREDLNEDEWKEISKTVEAALVNLNEFRLEEGKSLDEEFKLRIANILNLLDQVEPHEKARIEAVKERIQKNLSEFREDHKVDQNRFEQEMIYYIEKFDITEEKVRLKKHCSYFLETMDVDGPIGKKLGFITQEIGREINTLGSKANEVNLQKIVIQMKDELEKIKEQLLNIL
tara:strand:- start:537 stop:1406 length:870 start_codon:yes stop_codon:yes gene_type:complete